MLNIAQLREFIIKPALHDLVMYSPEAEELLVFTCAVESNGCSYIKQESGPALGIYQMEPRTYNDIWQNYVVKKGSLILTMISNFHASFMPDEQRLMYDWRFATAMARLFYAIIPEPLPNPKDIDALWCYYKIYYNTKLGAAQKAESIKKYSTYLGS